MPNNLTLPRQPSFARNESFANLRDFITDHIGHSKQVLTVLKNIDQVMASSKGRDKLCGIVQYIAKMIALSAIESNLDHVQYAYSNQQMKVHLVALRTWKSLSQARKIFRFLKFIGVVEDITKAGKKAGNNPSLVNYLELLGNVSSFFYYILDNIVWFIHSQILNDVLAKDTKRRFVYTKNLFSFGRVCLSILSGILIIEEKIDEKAIMIGKLLDSKQAVIRKFSAEESLVRELIKKRFESRNAGLSLVLYIIRFIMLYKSLRFPRYKELNGVFVAFLGFLSNIISVVRYITRDSKGKDFSEMNVRYRECSRQDIVKSFSSVFK